jgi:hypothetical protein
MEEYRKAIGDLLFDLSDSLFWENSPPVLDQTVRFLDSCCWALAFGGPFAEEIICVVEEVLQNDTDRD